MQPAGDEEKEMDLDSLLDLDPELFSMEGRTEEDKDGPEGGKKAPTTPKIVVSEERKTSKHARQRVSSVLENGAEGLEHFKPAEVARSLDKPDGHQDKQPEATCPEATETTTAAASDRSTDSTSIVKSASKAAMKLLKLPRRPITPRLRKKAPKGFETSSILHQGAEEVQMTARIREVPEPGQFKLKQFPGEGMQEMQLHKPVQNDQNGSPPTGSADRSNSPDELPSKKERPNIAKHTRNAADDKRLSKPHPLTVSVSASSTVPALNGGVRGVPREEAAGKEKAGELSEIDAIVDQMSKLQESLQN